ncbi:MAG: hypothetical protein ABSG36_16420 [Acidimicrobiales bacterium]
MTSASRTLSLGVCVICRVFGRGEAHHPTAKDAAGGHFDECWTVFLCLTCHNDLHRLWSETGLFDLRTDPVVLRRHRTLSLVDFFAERSPVLSEDERAMLAAAVEVLGQTDTWREVDRARA